MRGLTAECKNSRMGSSMPQKISEEVKTESLTAAAQQVSLQNPAILRETFEIFMS